MLNILIADDHANVREGLKQILIKTDDMVVAAEVAVLVLSMYPEYQYALRVLRVGADGYLTKESAPNDLITAIRKVYSGEKYMSSYLAEKLALGLNASSAKLPHKLLTYREYLVIWLAVYPRTLHGPFALKNAECSHKSTFW